MAADSSAEVTRTIRSVFTRLELTGIVDLMRRLVVQRQVYGLRTVAPPVQIRLEVQAEDVLERIRSVTDRPSEAESAI